MTGGRALATFVAAQVRGLRDRAWETALNLPIPLHPGGQRGTARGTALLGEMKASLVRVPEARACVSWWAPPWNLRVCSSFPGVSSKLGQDRAWRSSTGRELFPRHCSLGHHALVAAYLEAAAQGASAWLSLALVFRPILPPLPSSFCACPETARS